MPIGLSPYLENEFPVPRPTAFRIGAWTLSFRLRAASSRPVFPKF